MNEQKRAHHEYFSPSPTKQQLSAEELLNTIKMFMSRNNLSFTDFHILNKLVKQLAQQIKDTVPNKVLRSIQSKFETVQKHYTR